MRFTVYHNVVEADGLHDEAAYRALSQTLYFRDPNCQKDFQYREGAWDGMRDYFLDLNHTRFPTGHLSHVLASLARQGVRDIKLVDERSAVPEPAVEAAGDVLEGVELRPYQTEALRAALRRRQGIIHAPPRSGKTVIQAAVARCLDVPSVLCVEKQSLLQQHYELFRKAGLDVGRLGSGYRELDHQHVVATFQTLYKALHSPKRGQEVREWLATIGLAQCDEVHHLGSAMTYYRAFAEIPAPYRLGYSGTPFHALIDKDFHYADFGLLGLTGPLLYRITSAELRQLGFLATPTLYMIPIRTPGLWRCKHWQTIYKKGVTENTERNRIVVRLATYLANTSTNVLILVKELKHGRRLLELLSDAGVGAVMSSGGNTITTCYGGQIRQEHGSVADVAAQIAAGQLRCVIGTQVYDEGVDIPHLHAVILASAGKSNIKTVQRIYRSMTATEGKTRSLVFDFDDNTCGPLRAQSAARVKAYRHEQIEVRGNLPPPLQKFLR